VINVPLCFIHARLCSPHSLASLFPMYVFFYVVVNCSEKPPSDVPSRALTMGLSCLTPDREPYQGVMMSLFPQLSSPVPGQRIHAIRPDCTTRAALLLRSSTDCQPSQPPFKSSSPAPPPSLLPLSVARVTPPIGSFAVQTRPAVLPIGLNQHPSFRLRDPFRSPRFPYQPVENSAPPCVIFVFFKVTHICTDLSSTHSQMP